MNFPTQFFFFFFFLIGNKTFIEKKIEHHAHDGEHSEQETDTI